jgi:hypothetical protein
VTWPAGRAAVGDLEDTYTPDGRAAPGAYPIPAGRGRWRVTLHARDFTASLTPYQTSLAALPDAANRKLTRAWNTPAQLDFTIDGRSDQASLIAELQQDVMAWRWDDTAGADRAMFRGVVSQTSDTVSEESHLLAVTAHDYAGMFARRLLTNALAYNNVDQDDIVADLVSKANNVVSVNGTPMSPGSVMPLTVALVNPDGTTRTAKSGQARVRNYNASTDIATLLGELAAVINGFDYDVLPTGLNGTADALRLFYPYQGVQRSDLALVYGSSVTALTRQIDSGAYGNFWRAVGNNGSADPAAPQLVAETWNTDANSVSTRPVGLWMSVDNAPSVVTQATLNDQANGDLSMHGTIIPTYTLTLAPGFYGYGSPYLGDVVPLVVRSGRLNVNTNVRVLGITYTIGADGQEDVALTVGQPGRTLVQMIQQSQSDVNALARR